MFSILQALKCARMLTTAYAKESRPLFFIEDDSLYVVIKGLDSVADTMQAFDCDLHPLHAVTNVCVHEGFYEIFSRMLPEVYAMIEKHKPRRVYFFGHSLGGAVAALLGYRISFICHVDSIVYTLGCPRVGNKEFVRAFANAPYLQHWRIVNDKDFIPTLPAGPFKHCGVEMRFAEDGSIIGQMRTMLHRFLYWVRYRTRDLSDHDLTSYLLMLEKAHQRINRDPACPQK